MTVYVYARSSSTDGRFLALYSGTDNNNSFDEDTKQGIGSNGGAVLGVAKFEITKGETKYIGSTGSGINIYAIGVVTGGETDEKVSPLVSVTPATYTESGIKAHTVTDFGRYQCGDSYVPYSGVTAPVLGHDYANTTGTVSTMPTADAKGSYTATCKRDSHAETFELPALNSPKYARTASGEQTSYTYKDAETGCTVTFTAGTVEADQNAAESWSLDFTKAPDNPAVGGTSATNLSNGEVICDVLTFGKGTSSSNSKYHNSGYLSLQAGSSLTFEAKAVGALTITYTSGSSGRGFTVTKGDVTVGSGSATTEKAQVVELSDAGNYKISITGGENKFGTISLTYK